MAVLEFESALTSVTEAEILSIENKWRAAIIPDGDRRFAFFGCNASHQDMDAVALLKVKKIDFGEAKLLIPVGPVMTARFKFWQDIAKANEGLLKYVSPDKDGWFQLSVQRGLTDADLEMINTDGLLKNQKGLTMAGLCLNAEAASKAFMKENGWKVTPQRVI